MECDQINTFIGDRQDLHNPNLENIMAFTLGPEESEYIADTLSNARSLLDSVHCYDTDEYRRLSICMSIMRGNSLEDAISEYNDE